MGKKWGKVPKKWASPNDGLVGDGQTPRRLATDRLSNSRWLEGDMMRRAVARRFGRWPDPATTGDIQTARFELVGRWIDETIDGQTFLSLVRRLDVWQQADCNPLEGLTVT